MLQLDKATRCLRSQDAAEGEKHWDLPFHSFGPKKHQEKLIKGKRDHFVLRGNAGIVNAHEEIILSIFRMRLR